MATDDSNEKFKSEIDADDATRGENHADILQEGLVLYLEVGEEEDNLVETKKKRWMEMNWRKYEEKSFYLFPVCSRPLQNLNIDKG